MFPVSVVTSFLRLHWICEKIVTHFFRNRITLSPIHALLTLGWILKYLLLSKLFFSLSA